MPLLRALLEDGADVAANEGCRLVDLGLAAPDDLPCPWLRRPTRGLPVPECSLLPEIPVSREE